MIPPAEHKAETAAIGELQGTLKALSSELGEKVGDIQKQDKIFKDLQTSQVLQSTGLPNKLNKICKKISKPPTKRAKYHLEIHFVLNFLKKAFLSYSE